MPVLPTRYDLLRARLERFTRVLPGVEKRDVKAVHGTRVASRRLRELLPVLQLDGPTAAKLNRHLRKVTRRLGGVREADVLLLVMDELHESGRFHEPAIVRVKEALVQAREQVRADLPAKRAASDLRRVGRKMNRVARRLQGPETAQTRRAWRWALDARVSRRAAALKQAILSAGAVYLAERVHDVRIALKKLRYALELEAEANGLKTTADLRHLKRMQELLGRQHDLHVLVDRVRQMHASDATPSIAAWRDLDAFVVALEQSCRRLHARYVGERQSLLEICDRMAGSQKGKSAGLQRIKAAGSGSR